VTLLDRIAEPAAGDSTLADPCRLLAELQELRQQVASEADAAFAQWRPLIQRRSFLPSALNLAAYLALRRRDLRPLQTALVPWGLSSLGRSEGRVLPNLDAVIATLAAVCGDGAAAAHRPPLRAFTRGARLLHKNTDRMFGAPRDGRHIRIMVTLPAGAATDLSLVRTLVQRGMDCARINCAHDGVGAWAAMVEHVRRAARAVGRPCTVLMDLGGAKVRTGAVLTPGPGARLHPGMGILLTRVVPTDPDRMPF
jgi:pyruvate kinase